MEIYAGFDMVPRLSKGETDRQNWQTFLSLIKEFYQYDDLVKVNPNYIEFEIGEHLMLPFESHKFLRFSSRVSGRDGQLTNEYINTTRRLARGYFGSRIQYWSGDRDQHGFYGWKEVYESFSSYAQPDKPDEPDIPNNMAQVGFGIDPLNDLEPRLFEVQSVAGKRKGVVARVNIAKGTRIIQEKPLLTVESLALVNVVDDGIASNLKSLSKTEQRQFLSLRNNFPGKHPFSGIVKTNLLPLGPDSVTGGVFATICLINHSCLPNTHNNWNAHMKNATIHALRNIKAGEELTITYSKDGDSDSRRAYLKDTYNFDCDCNVCSLPGSQLQKSDNRRLRIQALYEKMEDVRRLTFIPDNCLADCHTLSRILEQEYRSSAGVLQAKLYCNAFQVCIAHSDQARASAFARREYELRVICEGEDSPETQRAKKLIDNPSEHGSFGVSQRWKTSKGLIPKGVDAARFEKWLWRQDK